MIEVQKRPKNARLRMEITKPNGDLSIFYNHDHFHLLRIALALQATRLIMTDIH